MKIIAGAGKMTQWLRTPALAGDPGSVPNSSQSSLTPGDLTPLSSKGTRHKLGAQTNTHLSIKILMECRHEGSAGEGTG